MTDDEYYEKLHACIARFKNGEERYLSSATFNKVVQMLIRDCDPYEIIDLLCGSIDDMKVAFEKYAQCHVSPTTVIIEENKF